MSATVNTKERSLFGSYLLFRNERYTYPNGYELKRKAFLSECAERGLLDKLPQADVLSVYNTGTLPPCYTVHHIRPRWAGGQNSFDNFLIVDQPTHFLLDFVLYPCSYNMEKNFPAGQFNFNQYNMLVKLPFNVEDIFPAKLENPPILLWKDIPEQFKEPDTLQQQRGWVSKDISLLNVDEVDFSMGNGSAALYPDSSLMDLYKRFSFHQQPEGKFLPNPPALKSPSTIVQITVNFSNNPTVPSITVVDKKRREYSWKPENLKKAEEGQQVIELTREIKEIVTAALPTSQKEPNKPFAPKRITSQRKSNPSRQESKQELHSTTNNFNNSYINITIQEKGR